MRRAAVSSAILLLACVCLTHAGSAQSRRRTPASPAAVTSAAPPHAWLFGVWTGGLFPVLDGMAAQDCRTQPTVVFSRDTVGHASLLASGAIQRVIETVRTTPTGAEFRFAPDAEDQSGFGCEDPNVLHVSRGSGTIISFPNCAAFPYPLERCPAA